MFSSMVLQEKTLVTEFYGSPDTWGATMWTIKASSGHFTCMTTFGHQIAAACDDHTVGIYDSVTGVLKLSLSPGGAVQAIRGSSDGSTLFCAHQGLSVSTWDIQTGGLIHSFVLESQVEDIAICYKGQYLACGFSNGSVKIWEVTSKMEVASSGEDLPVTHICWLEPGEQLVVVRGVLVQVWDIAGRKVLRSLTMEGPICGVAYAQKLNRLAIAATSQAESIITIINPQTGKSITNRTLQKISCLAFSPITKEFVCGMKTPGLELFSVPEQSWRQFDHPATITSLSMLPNGTVVANIVGSGIQLLNLDEEYSPPQQPTISTLTVQVFDEGNIIAITPTSCDHITLLESATMSPLLTIPAQDYSITADHPPILCASLQYNTAVYCFEGSSETHLELWRFGDEVPAWTYELIGQRLVGEISPCGSWLVAIEDDGPFTHLRVWDIVNGRCEVFIPIGQPWPTHPLKIEFESQNLFFSQHEGYCIPFVISFSESSIPRCSVTRHEQLPPAIQPQRYYNVDDSCEWVVSPSKQICWIPPGYIGLDHHGYWWAGNTLIMFGQDGVWRKLTFKNPPNEG